MTQKLHMYAQADWHDEAYILATRDALERLKDSIEKVLESGKPQATKLFVNDGEGYSLVVAQVDNETFDKLAVPYVSEVAANNETNRLWPWSIEEIKYVLKT